MSWLYKFFPIAFIITNIVILIALKWAAQFISLNDAGFLYVLEKIIKSLIICLIGWHLIRALNIIYWAPYRIRTGKEPHPFFINFSNFIIVSGTILLVINYGLDHPVSNILTASGLVGAGLAVALQTPITDAFSGLILDTEDDYIIGDWIRLSNDIIGKVTKVKWRTTTLITPENITYVVPNSALAREGYQKIPLNYIDMVEVSLDHNVTLDHGASAIMGALTKISDLDQKLCFVGADKSTEGGIVYTVRYPVTTYDLWRETKHKVLQTITDELHKQNLRISESLGDWGTSDETKIWKPVTKPSVEQIIQNVDLFNSLDQKQLAALSQKLKPQYFESGQIIVKQNDPGNSMFVIAQGLAEVLAHTSKGAIKSIALLGYANYFGEISLLTNRKRTADVIAKTNTIVYEIEKKHISELLKNNPELVDQISHVVSKRQHALKEATRIIKEVKTQDDFYHFMVKEIKKFFNIKS